MFGFNFDKKTLYIVLIVLVVLSLSRMTIESVRSLLLTLPAVIIAITFHEFAHAYVADRLGDTTPRSQGRLTLNPLAHLDPMGTILLIFAHVGWGKPVEINPNNFTSNHSKSACEAMVSLAGPLMNFIIAIIAGFIYRTLYLFAPETYFMALVALLVYMIIIVNIGLGVFNLIPLPPLDGEKIFRHILPYKAQEWLDTNAYILNIIFIVLWFTGYLGDIVAPVIGIIGDLIFKLVDLVFSVFV